MSNMIDIVNTTKQLITINCSTAGATKLVESDISPNFEGSIHMRPEAILHVESHRLDDGQLLNLERLLLISTTMYPGTLVVVDSQTHVSLPVNYVSPVILGEPAVDEILYVDNGVWSNQSQITFTYQWFKDGVAIDGETDSSYTVVDGDLGTVISVEVLGVTSIGKHRQRATIDRMITALPSVPITLFKMITQTSVTPDATKSVLTGTTAFRIWSGETPVTEAYFDLYIRINSTIKKMRMSRWESRLISVDPDDAIGFGTSDGRIVTLTPDVAPMSLVTSFDATGTVNCDKAGPPLWEPSTEHITLVGNKAFEIVANGTERIIFISEFDGTTWSPQRWARLNATGSLRFHTTCNQIALANYDGAVLTVNAPAGSIIGGTSNTMTISDFPVITGTTYSVSDATEFNTAIANVVAGDEIVLGDGTYAMGIITQSSFVANHNIGGRLGMEGILIRSASGNRESCVVAGSFNILTQRSTPTMSFGFKDFKVDVSGTALTGIEISGGKFRASNIRVSGAGGGNTGSDLFIIQSFGVTYPIDAMLLFCTADNSYGDCFNFSGNAATNSSSRVISVACEGYLAGNVSNAQCYTSHFGLLTEDYGGYYHDAHTYVIQNDNSTTPSYLFFTNTAKGSRNAAVLFVSGFGCNFTECTSFSLLTSGYLAASKISSILSGTTSTLIRESTNLSLNVIGNLLTGTIGRCWFPNITTTTAFLYNIISGFTDGFLQSNSTGVGAATATANTFVGNTTALNLADTNLSATIKNNACKTNGTSINCSVTSMAKITSSSNIFDPIVDVDFAIGANDVTGSDAELDVELLPIVNGNCDGTGDTNTTDWIGGTDYQGFPLQLSSLITDRGARCRPRIIPDAELIPDIW